MTSLAATQAPPSPPCHPFVAGPSYTLHILPPFNPTLMALKTHHTSSYESPKIALILIKHQKLGLRDEAVTFTLYTFAINQISPVKVFEQLMARSGTDLKMAKLNTGLVYDKDEGTVTFEKDDEKITFKMSHKMEASNRIDFKDINTDSIPPFVLGSNDDRKKTYYSDNLTLGPEYREDESISKDI
ncbi:hypothetical protein Tco_1219609 [Tanacetum coccineum]